MIIIITTAVTTITTTIAWSLRMWWKHTGVMVAATAFVAKVTKNSTADLWYNILKPL